MIGLKSGKVQVVPHQLEWQTLYEKEKVRIQKTIGDLLVDIQHVGSTSVPGLDAKPILDIAIAVEHGPVISQCVTRLCTMVYIDEGDAGADGGYFMVKECEPEIRTYHVHIVEQNDPQWHNYLLFRDVLISNDRVRKKYQMLKKTLEHKYYNDRKSYTAAKSDFIKGIIRESMLPDHK
jgi:GrpB-like predicted nucleotidyltransferase (UPF0157 family)